MICKPVRTCHLGKLLGHRSVFRRPIPYVQNLSMARRSGVVAKLRHSSLIARFPHLKNNELVAFSYSCSARWGGARARARIGTIDYEHEHSFTEHEHGCRFVGTGDWRGVSKFSRFGAVDKSHVQIGDRTSYMSLAGQVVTKEHLSGMESSRFAIFLAPLDHRSAERVTFGLRRRVV